MYKVGITGGIGSGKSIICQLFSSLGIAVYDADNAAKKLMITDQNLKREIINCFGKVYDDSGNLKRSLLAEKVFSNKEALLKLNGLVHPFVVNDYVQWERKQNSAYVMREAAILFESGTDAGLDFIIAVDAPEEVRVTRSMLRDNRTAEQVRSIMLHQLPSAVRNRRADFVINNDGETALLPVVWKLHEKFTAIGSHR